MYKFNPENWTKSLFDTIPRKFSFKARTEEELSKWQCKFREELAKTLGLSVIEQRGLCNLNPQQEEEIDLGDYIREKWWISTEPDFRLPFYLLRPKNITSPKPLVLAVHGHNETGKKLYAGIYHNEKERREIAEGERDIAVQAVKGDCISIAPDMRAFGELKRSEDQKEGRGFCHTLQMHAQLFGRTLVGDRVWDVGRLIDYAKSRPEIDEKRIAITGNSGGGTVSLFAAAVDQRIKVAVPSCYFCTFQHSIGSIHHCVCNYIPGILRLGEMYDVAGLIAPRPILIITGEKDPIFPYEGVCLAFEKLRRIYKIVNAEDRCELYTGEGGHRYYKKGAWPFIHKWL